MRLPDKEINKEAWIKANEIFRKELEGRDINEGLDVVRNTALFLLGTDLANLSRQMRWGPNDVEAHMESLMRRVMDIARVIGAMNSKEKAQSSPKDC